MKKKIIIMPSLDYDISLDYIDLRCWDYIQFAEPYDKFVIYNNGAKSWTEEQILVFKTILITSKFES